MEKAIKEKEQTQEVAIVAMIKNTNLSDKDIANALGLTVESVRNIRAKTK